MTKQKADRAAFEAKTIRRSPPSREQPEQVHRQHEQQAAADQDDSEDEYAPSLPANTSRVGPTVPSIQDLQYRNGRLQCVN